MSNETNEPTMEHVAELQERHDEMMERAEEIGGRLEELTDELAQLLADGMGGSDEAGSLRQERKVLQDEHEELHAALPILETKIREDRATASEAAARVEIKRLSNRIRGLRQGQDAKVHAFQEAVEAVEKAGEALGRNVRAAAESIGDAEALAERFGLPVPDLSGPAVPEVVVGEELARLRQLQNQLPRQRRPGTGYRPDPASNAGSILEAAGPKPKPELSERALEARRRNEAAEERFARQTRELAKSLPVEGWKHGAMR